jgi:hypothetical protein
MQDVVVCAAVLRASVERHLRSGEPVPKDLVRECALTSAEAKVDSDGRIRIVDPINEIDIEFVPKMNGPELNWSCRTIFGEHVPGWCREST